MLREQKLKPPRRRKQKLQSKPLLADDIEGSTACYPPRAAAIEFLGPLAPSNPGAHYARYGGSSSVINHTPLFLFGETFELSRSKDGFVRVAGCAVARGSFERPLICDYQRDGISAFVRELIPHTWTEQQDCFFLEAFDPMVQIPGRDFGLVWFLRARGNGDDGEFSGIGVAEVRIGLMGAVVVDRKDDVIFDGSGPRWGDISSILYGDYIYIYGSHIPDANGDVPVYVCRVPYRNRAYWNREQYAYWTGREFINYPPPVPIRTTRFVFPQPDPFKPRFRAVMKNIQSGSVFHSRLFGDHAHFAFLGCDLSGDGHVRLRLAEAPTGPWFGGDCLVDISHEDRGNIGCKSGVYAHAWASDMRNGEIVFSWSEPRPGGVEMARVRLEIGRKKRDNRANSYELLNRRGGQRRHWHREVITDDFEADDEGEDEDDDDSIGGNEYEYEAPTVGPKSESESVVEDKEEDEKNPCEREWVLNFTLAKLSGEITVDDAEDSSDSEYIVESVIEPLINSSINLSYLSGPANYRQHRPYHHRRMANTSVIGNSEYQTQRGSDSNNALPQVPRPAIAVPTNVTGSWIMDEVSHEADDENDDVGPLLVCQSTRNTASMARYTGGGTFLADWDSSSSDEFPLDHVHPVSRFTTRYSARPFRQALIFPLPPTVYNPYEDVSTGTTPGSLSSVVYDPCENFAAHNHHERLYSSSSLFSTPSTIRADLAAIPDVETAYKTSNRHAYTQGPLGLRRRKWAWGPGLRVRIQQPDLPTAEVAHQFSTQPIRLPPRPIVPDAPFPTPTQVRDLQESGAGWDTGSPSMGFAVGRYVTKLLQNEDEENEKDKGEEKDTEGDKKGWKKGLKTSALGKFLARKK